MNKEALFNQFLHGEMTDKEFEEFKLKLDANSELREEFRIHQVAYQNREADLKSQLSATMHTKNTGSPTPTKPNKIKPLSWISRIAAVFVIAATAFYLLQKSTTNNITKALLVDNYLSEKHLPPPVKMGEQHSADTWTKVISLYRNGKYREVESELKKIAELNEEQSLYLGLSYLYQDPPKYAEAKKHFGQKIIDRDTIILEESLWYGALSALQLNDTKTAINHLNAIVTTRSWKKDEAEQLLMKLQE